MSRKPKLPVEVHPIAEWAATLLVMLFGTAMVAQPYVIPTPSMEGTLLVGDHVIVDKLAYAPASPLGRHLLPYQDVKRGDMVVIEPPFETDEIYVKRIVGMPGDRIRFVDKQLFINGHPVEEPYVSHSTDYLDPYRDNFPAQPNTALPPNAIDMLRNHVRNGELRVPPGRYLALGDNRDNSLDGRYFGLLPRENIIGKPIIVWWSFDAPTEHWLKERLHPGAMIGTAVHFFDKTRWNRMFRPLRGYPLEVAPPSGG